MATVDSTTLPYRVKDLTGLPFGRWTVVEFHSIDKWRSACWLCRCQCGTTAPVRGAHLTSGLSTQCKRCRRATHGQAGASEYTTWQSMLQRCCNPNNCNYKRYGDRGIRVCGRWQKSFANFLADMGPRPSSRHSIDRIDNSLGYSKDNCRWATTKEQSRNTRSNHKVTHDGKTMCLAEWAEETGIARHNLQHRLKQGWSVERALTEPVHQRILPKGTDSSTIDS